MKKGDKILVAYPIENRHRLAFSLAVEQTLNEVKKLFEDSAGKMVGGVEMRDVFLMTQKEMDTAGVQYTNRTDKTGTGGK